MSRSPKQSYWSLAVAVRLILLVLLTLSNACSFPRRESATSDSSSSTATATQPPVPTPTQQPLPPALVESDPPQGTEIPLDRFITLYFNQAMDRSSVEESLQVGSFLVGDLIWSDDRTMTINPGGALPPSSEISIDIETGARATSGQPLPQPINLTYRTVGYLQVAQKLPEPDSVDVNPSSAIVASFNHPVVALGADPTDLPVAFRLQPEASGRGEWLNTSTYIFYPDPPLGGGQAYTVQIEPSLHGTDGNPLETSEAWSFTTSLPALVQTSPADASQQVWLDAPVVLTFNQPMDRASVEASFRLETSSGSPVLGTFEWNETGSEVNFQPAEMLERDQLYTLSLSQQARGQNGALVRESYRGQFRSVPALRVVSTEPAQGGELPNYNGIVLRFSAPIDEQSAAKNITIEPKAANFSYYFDPQAMALFYYPTITPSTSYRLVIAAELIDRWGGRLGEEMVLEFRSAPLQPGVYIGAGGAAHFITASDTSLSAQTSGLTSLPISLGSVPLEDAIRMLGPGGYDYRRSYQPADQQTWQQPLQVDPDKAEPVAIYVSPDQQPLATGFYRISFNIPENYSNSGPSVVLVSNINLLLKISATDALVWAVDLRSNSPLADAPVSILDEDGSLLAAGRTDAQGVFTTTIPTRSDPYQEAFAQIGLPGDDTFAFSQATWRTDVEPWHFNVNIDLYGPRQQIYLYTDRPIYRPGQTVYFRGIVRQAYNGRYETTGLKNVPIKINDGIGRELASLDLPLSAFGTIHGEFKLSDQAQPGFYNLNNPDMSNAYVGFQVAEYRKPEINLQVSFSEEQALIGQDLQARVEARYFFDAPAGNVPVEWALYAAPAFFDLPGYQVGLQGAESLYSERMFFEDPLLGEKVLEGQSETGPDGTFQLDLNPPAVTQRASRLRYTLEVTVQDESGLPVSGRDAILANPAEFYIGVRPDSWVQQAGRPAGFDVQIVDWDGQPAGEQALRARFDKVEWVVDEGRPAQPGEGLVYIPSLTPVASTDLRSGPDGRARVEFTPAEAGTYQISVKGLEGSGAQALTEVLLWAGGPGQFTNPDLAQRRLRLVASRQEYQPGETAEVYIPNPLATPAQMLITTERSTILSQQVLVIPPGGSTLSFPLSAAEAPNIYISATLVGENDQGLADFRQGYLNLNVVPQEQTLDVQILSQPERLAPGETLSIEIQVRDSAGQPVEGEFSLAVVDLAALALAEPNSLDIVSAFYSPQPLGVQTGLPLAIYAGGQVNVYLATGRGGGGGDGELPVVRQRFPDTAFWQADVVTGPDGKASLSVPLPDTLTTWQIETRGVTEDTRVGQAISQVVTSKELIVRPATPRFLVAGDHTQLAAIVQNNTAQDLQVVAALDAQGFSLDDPGSASQTLVVPANGRARLNWWGTALDQAQADLVFSARADGAPGGALEDAARPALGPLPILRYLAPQTYRTAGSLDQAGEQLELVSLPRFFDPQTMASDMNRLEVELSPSLAAAIASSLEVLETFPYACSEQTVSRFLPNLENYRLLRQFGIDSPAMQERLERTLDESLQSLLTSQNYDGGWGWWPASPTAGQSSDPFVTAYVLFGLSRARQAGALLSDGVLLSAANYLTTGFTQAGDPSQLKPLPDETWQLDRLAFELFALTSAQNSLSAASGQQPDQTIDLAPYASLFSDLYNLRSQLNPWAQALLALAFESQSPGSGEAHTLISDLQASAVRSAAGAHWELSEPEPQNMVTSISNSAIVVYSLAQRDPSTALLTDAVRYLMANRQADQSWSSTYATAWTLMALTEVIKGTGELGGDYTYGAWLNNAPLLSGQASGPDQLTPARASIPISELYPDAPNQLAIQRDGGAGKLYYSALLQVSRPVEQAEPAAQGVSISRQYFPAGADCQAAGCTPVTSALNGEMVTVRLTLTLPHDVHYLMVEDYIPAGAEILDTRLKTSQQGLNLGPQAGPAELPYDPANPFADGWGWWLFRSPQVYDDHIAWAADYLPAGTYELTYTLVLYQPGEYRVLPARAWQFYFPEVQGSSAGGVFEVK